MFVPKRPDPVKARHELQQTCMCFLGAMLAIRVAPYALHFLSASKTK